MKSDIFNIFRKFVENIEVCLKSGICKGYCTRRPVYIYDKYLSEMFVSVRNDSDKSCREIQNTPFMFVIPPPPLKVAPFVGKCGKNIVESGRTQMTI